MGHNAESRARAYEKTVERRRQWFADNGPCRRCGSWESLELDHIDPSTKENHAIWSWSDIRMLAELEKCQALCRDCHKLKSAAECSARMTGNARIGNRKISDEQINKAKELRAQGMTVRKIAEIVGFSHNYIAYITSRPSSNDLRASITFD